VARILGLTGRGLQNVENNAPKARYGKLQAF
jgi:hypothetical protein